jgi:predicted MFS family arabinose efflux permease
MRRSLFVLFAVTSGFAVGNLYFAQPMLGAIAKDLHFGIEQSGFLITAVQIGYVLGVVLLVPLGDLFARNKLVPAMLVISGLAHFAIGASQSYSMLLVTMCLLGVSTISGQLLVPLAGELSDDSNRGRNVSTVVSGMLLGILGSRILSGTLADLIGWHFTFVVIGALNLALAYVLYVNIPVLPKPAHVSYPKLVSSVFSLQYKNPKVLLSIFVNAANFTILSAIWTSITFLLSGPPFHYPPSQIGLWGFVGIIGAVMARNTGRLIDGGKAKPAAIVAFITVMVSLVIGSYALVSLAFLVVMLILLDLVMQIIGITNQTRLISLFPKARSRINAAYVSGNFIGGAIGSAGSAVLYPILGWSGLMWLCAAISACSFVIWLALNRKGSNLLSKKTLAENALAEAKAA